MVVITVNGMFKDIGEQHGVEDLILGFVKTFVLRRFNIGQGMFGCCVEYRISNEQVLIYRPSIMQLNQAFPANHRDSMQTPDVSRITASNRVVFCSQNQITKPLFFCSIAQDVVSQDDKDGMVIMFQELSNLVPLWCIRFLEQASWQFKNALELFVHLCEDGQVPDVAFLDFAQK